MSNNKQILLAEDNVLNQKVTTLLLEKLGFHTDIACNGREAVDAVNRNQYTVILMDCMMPEMDGFEASRAIRDLEKKKDQYTPIIAVTAMAMSGDYERCIHAGMDDYITKPINCQILGIKINHWSKQQTVSRNQELAKQHPPGNNSAAHAVPLDLAAMQAFYESGDLHEILSLFVSLTPDLLRRLDAAVSVRDAGVTIHIAHELKSSGTTIGARDLTKLALYLQHLAGTRNWPEVEQTAQDLTICYKQIEKYINTKTATKI